MKQRKLQRFHIKETKFSFDRETQITSGDKSYTLIKGEYECINCFEEFFCMYLDQANHVLGIAKVGQGTTGQTAVNTKLAIKIALDLQASAIIMHHNHPSGKLTPSDLDKKLTNEFHDICEFFSIKLLDHIISSENSYFSFYDEGLL